MITYNGNWYVEEHDNDIIYLFIYIYIYIYMIRYNAQQWGLKKPLIAMVIDNPFGLDCWGMLRW